VVIFSHRFKFLVVGLLVCFKTDFFFFRRIHEQKAKSKMNARNLSVVFAPTLMRSPDENTSLIRDLPLQRDFIEYIILHNHILFSYS
jgi:hypothetical protein